MADFTDTILAWPDEGAISTTPGFAPVAVAFSRFLAFLPTLIDAEHDLGDYTGQDPAVDAWISAAEAARKETLLRIDAVLERDAGHPGDMSLRRVAQLYRRVMLSDSADEVSCLRHYASHRRDAFLLPESGRAALRVNRLILAALGQLEAYLAIDDCTADELETTIIPDADYAVLPAA
jgi:hypothetical protein